MVAETSILYSLISNKQCIEFCPGFVSLCCGGYRLPTADARACVEISSLAHSQINLLQRDKFCSDIAVLYGEFRPVLHSRGTVGVHYCNRIRRCCCNHMYCLSHTFISNAAALTVIINVMQFDTFSHVDWIAEIVPDYFCLREVLSHSAVLHCSSSGARIPSHMYPRGLGSSLLTSQLSKL